MSLDKLRERVASRRRMPRLGNTPSTAIDIRTAEALCDLADVVRAHVDRQCEHCPHEHPMQEAMARVDGDHELARWLRGETDA